MSSKQSQEAILRQDKVPLMVKKVSPSKRQASHPSDEDVKMEESDEQKGSETQSGNPSGRYRPIRQVQEEYQKYTQMRQRGHSQSVIAAGDSSMNSPGTEVYIVDMKWIDQWRTLSNSLANSLGGIAASGMGKNNNQGGQSKTQGNLEDSTAKSEVFIPYFTNERIIIPQDTYLACGDPSSPYNTNLRDDLIAGKDYQVISKDQWRIIDQNYTRPDQVSVHPVRRFYEKMGLGIRTFPDIMYHKFEVLILVGGSRGPALDTTFVFFSKKKTWEEFKQRMVKIINNNLELFLSDQQQQNFQACAESFKLWSTTTDQLRHLQDNQDPTGKIPIRGYCLEAFINHSIDQMISGRKSSKHRDENDDRDLLIVEIGPHFVLESAQQDEENPEILAQCQYCFKIKNLKVHCKCMSVSYCTQQCQLSDSKYHQEKCSAIDTIDDWDMNCVESEDAMMGLTGLKNLKNSCYMSSSIQCLSHAIGLTNYFLKGHFKSELNYQNPLGAKGQLAIAYAKLLKQLWYDEQPSLAPWQFKQTIGRFASNFNNYDQQDSQELLNFMLDGLHEDLNRVQKKPIVPQIESEGFNDEKDAEDSWQNHLKRNQSIIVDLMHGQFKSTVKCPDCDKLSITFDPFMSVSLPIPEIKIVEKAFYWVPYDTSKKCVQDSFKFKSLEQMKTLRKYIATSYEVQQEQFELVIIQDDQVKRILPRYEQISSLNVNSIFIFAMEIPPQAFQVQSNTKAINRDISMVTEQMPQVGDRWNEKKGANELSKKLKQNFIQVILNFQVFSLPGCTDDDPEKYFPRLAYLRLDESLIQAHLDIFEYLKPLFKLYLDHKEGLSNSAHKMFKKRKNVTVPERVKTQLWDNMTLTQQYEAVFGPSDPSRKKLEDLPYLISILTRQDFTVDRDRCVFCQREQCTNCPLPFEELTLREYLNLHGVSTQSYFYYEDQQQKQLVANSSKLEKKKITTNGGSAVLLPSTPQKKNQANNLEFELQISFNAKQCWALYEIMIRSKKYQKIYPDRVADRQIMHFNQNDKVTIDDCFRQFMTPERLSHQNTWFCSRCKLHKQAVKKFQVFRTPPILVVNLKRFKGMQSKQNTLVHFPIEGLDMNNFVISQRQREAEPLVYDLFGVSNHYGQLQGGHYTAYAKNDGQWFRFNDDEVEEIENEASIVSNAAYNLFYARRDIKFDNLDYSAIRNVLKSSNQNTQNDQIQNHNTQPLLRFEEDFEMSLLEEEELRSDFELNPNEGSQPKPEQLIEQNTFNPPSSATSGRPPQKHWQDRELNAQSSVNKPKNSRRRTSRSRSQPGT